MKERPILMNAFSVKAILEGRKTQTRRVIKPQPPVGHWWNADKGTMILASQYYPGERGRKGCPQGTIGDRLWVRETCWCSGGYVATDPPNIENEGKVPSIFMSRWASRITLEVTGVRVEQVKDITEEDAQAEGIEFPGWDYRVKRNSWVLNFSSLWDSINAKRGFGWDVNPWVWVVEFARL